MSLYEDRLRRTLDAVHMQPVDKIPVSYSGPAYLAREMGLTIAEFIHDYEKAAGATIDFCDAHPEIDSVHSPIMCPDSLSTLWLSAVKSPGEELPDDELWQVDEREVIKPDDYQKIIDGGYGPWVADVMKNRLGDPMAKMQGFIEYSPICAQRLRDAGIPILSGASGGTPFEGFCGGRTLMNFFIDLMQSPELVKGAFAKAQEYILNDFAAQLEASRPVASWVGGWRAAPAMLSHDTWMEFVWPYLKEFILTTIDRGVVPVLHFDSCWESELETLRELPPKKCLLMLDGSTDMRRAREVLDDRMCLMGDVPATMLAFDSESAVYDYVTKLIDDVGPKTGLIISSGCDCPLNARPENVRAMFQAAADYRIG